MTQGAVAVDRGVPPVAAPVVAALAILAGAGWLGLYVPAVELGSCDGVSHVATARSPIQHVFVIIKENHAFENYFGALPGVAGNPPNGSFPVALGSNTTVAPFPLTGRSTSDLPHDHATELADEDGGRNDLFVAEAAADGFPNATNAVGYYTDAAIPQYYTYAAAYALGDHFFSGYLGPTAPNRDFDLAGTTDGQTSDAQPPAGTLTAPTILDQLTAAGVPWAYDYTGGITNQTPLEFAGVDHRSCEAHAVLPMSALLGQIQGSASPSVVFLDPSHDAAGVSEHPPDNVTLGASWTGAVVNAILSSAIGPSSAVLLFYDEAGGFWDPLAPPVFDGASDGFRIPFLVISDYTPSGLVVHTTMDPASVLAFLDGNWGLPPLNARVAGAPSLAPFFDFGDPARSPVPVPSSYDLNSMGSAPAPTGP